MLENAYQARLVKKLRRMFPGCIVLKNEPEYQPGIPDLTVLWYNAWALLEVKPRIDADQEPNQDWFVAEADGMCFGAFIYPENEKDVLDALQQSFQSRQPTRLSQR